MAPGAGVAPGRLRGGAAAGGDEQESGESAGERPSINGHVVPSRVVPAGWHGGL